ncbi:MAG: 50S ribosomal protein L7/L12 [Myxococcota bacterium]|jgi:large subunit ribosomal protein L7/L12
MTQSEVVDYIKNLKLSEVKGLIETLENELGVKASAPVMMGAVAAAAAPAAAAEEKTEFDVILTGFPETAKINVIKVVRELTSLGLKEAKALVEALPGKVKEASNKEDSANAKKKLEEVGATVEVK